MKFRWETEFKETEIGEIPKDWVIKTLDDIKRESIVGCTPLRRSQEYWVNGIIPWVTNKEVEYGSINYILDTEEKVSATALEKTNLKLVPPNSLIISFTASVGKVAINKVPLTTNQQFISFILKDDFNVIYYAYYFLISKEVIESFSGATPFSFITKEHALKIPVPYPPLPEQTRIVTVLSYFDDLIENKKRQNEILEKTAMAIFKNWFIDFEPFKDGEFVDSELGMIPKGWEVVKLKGLTKNIISGRGRYVIESEQGDYALWGANGILGYIKEYDLDGLAILTGRVGTLGKVFLVNEKFAISDNVLAVLPKDTFYTFFIYLWMKAQIDFESLNVGSTQPLITKSALGNENMIYPPPSILQKFHSLVEPLFQKIILNQKQIMLLRKIRDKLLPLLVFGKLRVEEV